MKNALLITLQDNNNIGNRLQNYALQTALEQYGCNVTNLDNGYTTKPTQKQIIKNNIKKCLGKLGNKKYADKSKEFFNSQLRRLANTSFTNKYISDIKQVTYANAFSQPWNSYDFAITGSDQVWHNWHKDPKELPYYYLEFMPEEKRVSYAASFGFEEFPEEDKAEHIKGLQGMHAISCRESSGCTLIKRETGRDAVHVLDPTLLLSADDWRQAEAPIPENLHINNSRYAFLYFLGEVPNEYQKFIDDLQTTREVKLIDFMDLKDEAIARCGVGEFLSLIDNADYVLTDSFHCTVFSILFQKEFTVFRRKGEGFEKMFGRIEDLLRMTGNTDKAFDKIPEDSNALSFEKLKENSIKYLEEVIK